MTLDDFVQQHIGTGVDFDGHYGYQCVDLYRQYVLEVLGFPQSPLVLGAKGIWDTAPEEYYEKVHNTPTNVPQKGDIVIWRGWRDDSLGHVAIFLYGYIHEFWSFDQNWRHRSARS